MKKILTPLLIFLTYCAWSQGYNVEYLKIGNVQQSWSTQSGSIDTMVIEVKPKGLYAEIGLYFDFSARGTSYVSGDSLEIQMMFRLPEKAEVTDMWLWINDSIIRAGMYDKWTASQIYEDIVDRRTDPAILYKYTYYYYDYWYGYYPTVITDLYMFRIFPMLTTLPRKAKITYMIPISDLGSNISQITLPANILQLSYLSTQKLKIKYFPANDLGMPSLAENSSQSFTQGTDPGEGIYYIADIQNPQTYTSLTLECKNTSNDNLFAGIYTDTDHNENFYQLMIEPNRVFGFEQSKKALFLFDYIDSNCNGLNSTQVLDGLKTNLLKHFTASDSFNIMISGIVTTAVSSQWISADSANVEYVFSHLNSGDFNSYSSLPSLLMDGLNFVADNGNNATMVLIASSNSHGAYMQANDLIDDLTSAMDSNKIAIHIVDLDDYNNYYEQEYIGGTTYYGNEYFYINLSMLTGGDYLSLQDESYTDMLSNISGKLSGFFSSFDLYVTLESGFTYSNYTLNKTSTLTYYDHPYMQVGKYNGSGRFRVIASAQMPDGEFFYNDTLIDVNALDSLDYATRAIWASQLLREMDSYTQTNSVIAQIINTSIHERVLSDYTAFLALEPGVGVIDDENNNGGGPVGTEESPIEENSTFSISSYPNPFSDQTTLSFYLPEDSRVTIEVYDLYGNKISVILDEERNSGENTVNYDADGIAAGTYICRISTNDGSSTYCKLIIMN